MDAFPGSLIAPRAEVAPHGRRGAESRAARLAFYSITLHTAYLFILSTFPKIKRPLIL